MHSRQAMALCCGIFTYTYNSAENFGIQYTLLDSQAREDGKVRIEAIAPHMYYQYQSIV